MSADADDDDKQFDASEQKLRKAREQGDIPRSLELSTAAMYLGAWLAFALAAGAAVRAWLAMASRSMGGDGWPLTSVFALAGAIGQHASLLVMGAAAIPAGVILITLFAQRGIVWTPSKLAFDIKRIDPFRNAAQKFGRAGLAQFAISLAKASAVCIGGWFIFRAFAGTLTQTALTGSSGWIGMIPVLIQQVLILALGASVPFAVVDMLVKWAEHRRRNRMTRQEMQDEHKDSEGDPHLKAARRRKAIDLALTTMLQDVEAADVVIVNPTHYAVALRWSRGSGRAPVCVAKGIDDVAARIRDRARQHRVPVMSDPPTARALHATVKIGAEIAPEHYGRVAAAIRFAEKMRQRARAGW